jgi:hypothetical protein
MSAENKRIFSDIVSWIPEISPARSRPTAWLVNAGWFSLLCGWIFVAAVAAFYPTELNAFIVGFIPIRRDTFGVVCFAASALWFVPSIAWQRVRYPLLRAVRLFGGAAMVYLLVNTASHPRTLWMPLTHFAPWPSELMTLILASGGFVISHVMLTRKG